MRVTNVLIAAAFTAILVVRAGAADPAEKIRAGMIGCDTSHVVAFTELLRDPKATGELAEMKIVAAYPGGSPDIPASQSHLKEYTDRLRGMDVEIVDSIDELLEKVDFVLLESIDGRPHLAQARPVIAAGKPLFIDKPIAGSLTDAMEIFRLAQEKNVPCFSSSAVRFSSGYQAVRNGTSTFGQVRTCTSWSPMEIEPHHPDLFWYGVHGVEGLFTILGPGCRTVTRTAPDRVVGLWKDGRQGTFQAKKEINASVEGSERSGEVGKFEGYKPLVVEIVKFFKSGKPPVSAEETLEIFAFMDAADESQRQQGAPVEIESVMAKAARQIGEAAR